MAGRPEKLPFHSRKNSSVRRMPSRAFFLVVSGILLLLFWLSHRASPPDIRNPLSKTSKPTSDFEIQKSQGPDLPDLPCRSLPGTEDVLVVLKTGSTELEDKLPIHLRTTLKCYPDYLIFSDYEEIYRGEHILDALDGVDPSVKADHPDFELWRRLQKGGRAALKPSERSGPISRPQGATGKPSNPGWKLDKWKFLPMLNRTLSERPDKKWYVFVETDTYILWQTLLNYLHIMDWTKPVYIGGQIWIGDIVFAHGGTGFAVSRPALEQVVHMFREHQKEWEDFTNGHWAGDCVLGKAFKDAGAPLTYAWPIWQADDIGNMNYERADNGFRLWCKPTISYHHLSPEVVEEMWDFEQDWMATTKETKKFLHHSDVYKLYVLPRVTKPKTDWDNHADNDEGPVDSLDACREVCEAKTDCLQYSLSLDLRCLTTSKPNLGEWSRGIDSGWVYERMKAFADDQSWCGLGEGWIMPG